MNTTRWFLIGMIASLAFLGLVCSGNSYRPDDPDACPSCHGLGKIGCVACGGTYDDYERKWRIGKGCKLCDKDGTVWCQRCRGSGDRHRK